MDTHVSVEACAWVWDRHCRRARELLARFVDTTVMRLAPSDPAPLRAALEAELAHVLRELDTADFGPVPAAPPPEEPRPVVGRSSSLAEARAQSARLQTTLMDLKARVVRLPGARP